MKKIVVIQPAGLSDDQLTELRKLGDVTYYNTGLRALGSQEHPGKSIDDLVEIIKRNGTDRYDPERGGDRYDNIENKHIDLFLLRREISTESKIFWQFAWSFYESPPAVNSLSVPLWTLPSTTYRTAL